MMPEILKKTKSAEKKHFSGTLVPTVSNLGALAPSVFRLGTLAPSVS